LGAAGRERVLGRFTWQVTAAGTADEYRRLLADPAPSPHQPERTETSPC
jgi:hypothetical protein